jgi:hypothetical protein
VDVVVGVQSHPSGVSTHDALRCAHCNHELGRTYKQPPTPALSSLVHQDGTPRYCLTRSALESYVLGTAKMQHDAQGVASGNGAAALSDEPHGASEAGMGLAADAIATGSGDVLSRLRSLEGSGADARVQLAQLMRVVLALDQRLRAVEKEEEDNDGEERKRRREATPA